jgi:hypothetical protein
MPLTVPSCRASRPDGINPVKVLGDAGPTVARIPFKVCSWPGAAATEVMQRFAQKGRFSMEN